MSKISQAKKAFEMTYGLGALALIFGITFSLDSSATKPLATDSKTTIFRASNIMESNNSTQNSSPSQNSQATPTNLNQDSRPFTSVMAPLTTIENWGAFEAQLKTLKTNGIDALTTDVWWGIFERSGNNRFEWDYYKKYAQTVRESGLKWIPILSFHQCGGNVGDDCYYPVPEWVWNLAPESEMKYKDERGVLNSEYVAPFYDGIYHQYEEAMSSFAENFSQFADIMPKIYISMGPAGELRYPSYAGGSGWSYPHRGYLNAYSDSAIRSYRNFLNEKYNGINGINAAWSTQIEKIDHIMPPSDGDNFFINGRNVPYGKDLLSWYQSVLEKHMDRMIELADRRIKPSFNRDLHFGVKLAGIHWQYNSPNMPHAAEYAAGLYDYEGMLAKIKATGAHLTFTCLEMDDANKFTAPFYSAPKSLVNQVSGIANRIGLPINGENALAIWGDNRRYDEIADVLRRFVYESFTLLRIQNVIDGNGNATQEMAPFRDKIVSPR